MEELGLYIVESSTMNQTVSISSVSGNPPAIQKKDPFTILASQIQPSTYNRPSPTEEKSGSPLDGKTCSPQTSQPINIQMALFANHLSSDNMGSKTSETFGRKLESQHYMGDGQHQITSERSKDYDDSLRNRKYPCPLCGKRFRFNSILSLHMRTHTGEKPFKCPYCDHRAAQKGNLKIHLRTHRLAIQSKSLGRSGEESHLLHELEQLAIIREKQANSTSPPSTDSNYISQNSLGVPCDGLSQPSSDLAMPVQEQPHNLIQQQSFRCGFCKGKFRKKEELDRHIRILHKPYKCTLCEFAAALEQDLLQHVGKVHVASASPQVVQKDPSKDQRPNEPFKCEVCGQVFKQSWFLKGHMRKHKDSYEHGCGVCGRRFKESWFLKNHMKVHINKLAVRGTQLGHGRMHATHNSNSQEIPSKLQSQFISRLHNEVLLAVLSERQKVLAEAGIELNSKKVLEKLLLPVAGQYHSVTAEEMQLFATDKAAEKSSHTQPPHNMDIGSTQGEEQALGLYSYAEKLNVLHCQAKDSVNNQIVNGSSSPDKSSRNTGFRGVLTYHSSGLEVNYARWTGRPSECPDCGRVFRTYHQLVLHSRVHRKQRQLRGQETPSAWKPNGSVHPQDYPHLLSAFSRPSESQGCSTTEPNAATGGLPTADKSSQASPQSSILYSGVCHQPSVSTGCKECSVCGKSFRTAQRLKVHSRIHTGEKGEKPYKCPFCDYAGSQFTSLKYHLQRHHNQLPTPHGDDPCKPWAPGSVRGCDEDLSLEPQQEPLDLSIKVEGGTETDRTRPASRSLQLSTSSASSASPLRVSSLLPSAPISFSTFSSLPCSSTTSLTASSSSSSANTSSPFSASSLVSSSLFNQSARVPAGFHLGSCPPFAPSLVSSSPFPSLYASPPLSVSSVVSSPPFSPLYPNSPCTLSNITSSSFSSFSLLPNSSVITSHTTAASSACDSWSDVTSSVCTPSLCTPNQTSAPSSLSISPQISTFSSLSTSPPIRTSPSLSAFTQFSTPFSGCASSPGFTSSSTYLSLCTSSVDQEEVNVYCDPKMVRMGSEQGGMGYLNTEEKEEYSLLELIKGAAGSSTWHPELEASSCYDKDADLEQRGKKEDVARSRCRELGTVGLFSQKAGHSLLPCTNVGSRAVGVIVSTPGEAAPLQH